MNTIETIYERKSCRMFCKDQVIQKEIVTKVLEAGTRAPSGKNLQPWRFVIVEDKKLISEMSSLCTFSRFISNASCLVLVYLDTRVSYDYKKDSMAIGACIQNMLLAACEYHIGSCWIGDILEKENEVRELIKGALNSELMAVLALGIENTRMSSRMKKTERENIMQKIDCWYSSTEDSGDC